MQCGKSRYSPNTYYTDHIDSYRAFDTLFLSLLYTLDVVDSCNYKLEKEDLCMSELFEMLDSVKVEIGILDWGIKMTTLKDGKEDLL